MLPHLIRKSMLDLTWDASALDLAAEFWLRLYEAAARAQGFTATPSHTVEIRLRGFPRNETHTLQDELARRVATSEHPAPEIFLHDADTVVLYSGVIRGNESPPVGLGLPLLAGAPFDGLFVEVRIEAVGKEGKLLRRGRVRTTLVLIGELNNGQLRLKAVWRSGTSGWEDGFCWQAPWMAEAAWLAALDRFRDADEVPIKLAKKLFLPSGVDRIGRRIVWLLQAPLGKPRLAGLLLRSAMFTFAIAAALVGLWWAIATERWLALTAIVVNTWWVFLFVWCFLRIESQLFFKCHRIFHDRYRAMYDETIRMVPMTRSEGDARLDPPAGRKYTADLEAAGYRYLGDSRLEPPVLGSSVYRTFLAPDGVTYLTAVFMTSTDPDPEKAFQTWPAAMTFLAYTYFPEDGRVTCLHGRHIGYRKKRTGPEHRARLVLDVEEPEELLRWHRTVVEEFEKEWERSPVKHERFEQFVRRMNDAQDEERMLYSDHPYTWGDHLRWYLQMPRRVYTKPMRL